MPKQNRGMIYIPTYGRLDKQKTLAYLSKSDRERTMLVVRPEEEVAAVRKHRGIGGVLTCDTHGVAAARQAVVEHTTSNVIIMLDDDLIFDRRIPDWSLDNARCVKSSQEDIDHAISWMYENCTLESPMACIGPKGNNNSIEARHSIENSRVMRAFAVHAGLLKEKEIRFDQFYYWEDFHVALSLLELGYKNLVNVDHRCDSVTNAVGGVQRHAEKMRRCALEFQKVHPTVKIRDKEMNDPETGRTVVYPDLTVYWKKAFRSKMK